MMILTAVKAIIVRMMDTVSKYRFQSIQTLKTVLDGTQKTYRGIIDAFAKSADGKNLLANLLNPPGRESSELLADSLKNFSAW